jgi:hypothetical protein
VGRGVCAVQGGMPCGPIIAGGQQAWAERGVAGRCGKAAGQSAPGGEGGADMRDPQAEREKGALTGGPHIEVGYWASGQWRGSVVGPAR